MLKNGLSKSFLYSFFSIFLSLFSSLTYVEAVSLIQINDDNIGTSVNQYQYTGSWQYGSQSGTYEDDNHWSNTINSTYQITFSGTQIDIYASKDTINGIAGISLDGGAEVLVDCYSPILIEDTLLYSSPPLSYGSHHLQVRVTGNKNSASTGSYIIADRAVIHSTNPFIVNVNDDTIGSGLNQFNYQGSWQYGSQNGTYEGDNHWSSQTGSNYSVNFKGSQILLFGSLVSNNGIAAVSIDNGTPVNVDCYSATRKDQVLLYTSPVLTQGNHTLKVTVAGTKNPNSTGFNIEADRVSILSYPLSVVPEPDFSYENLSSGLLRYRPISLLDREWNIEIYPYNFPNYPLAAIKASSAKYKLADSFGDTYFNNLYEWDYTFSFLDENGYPHAPVNAEDAYQMTENWFSIQLTNQENNKPLWITAVTGHYYYPHYSALWGDGEVDMLMSEIGENIKSTNAHLAFVRGAARQFAKPWGLQFSPWYGGYVLDYTSPSVWGTAGGPNYGHSLELANRSYFLTYMSGANELHAESASTDWFNGATLNSDGTYNLSPMGIIGQNFYAFSHSFVDRGIPFTPMAIMLDQYHGFTDTSLTETFYGMLASNHSQTVGFDYTIGQQSDIELFNTLWPQSFSESTWNESQYYLVNSPHGDMYDILLDNADLSVLREYPIVYVGGSVNMNSSLAAELEEYVNRGGTLVLNSSIAANFTTEFIGASFGSDQNIMFSNLIWNANGQSIPYTSTLSIPSIEETTAIPLLVGTNNNNGTSTLATLNAIGNGKVIVITPANLQDSTVLGFFVDSLVQPLNPFMVEGNIEYLINKNSTGWVLTLINNLGITKSPSTATVVDSTQVQTIQVTYKEVGKKMVSVTEMINNTVIPILSNSEFTVTVPAGGVVVLNIPTS